MKDQPSTIGISARMKELRGVSLDASQMEAVRAFVATRASKGGFGSSFKRAIELDKAQQELGRPGLSSAERSKWAKRIRKLEDHFTPYAKRAVIERNGAIAKAALDVFRQGGCTIADVLKQLYEQGVLCRTYKAGGSIKLSEREARHILQRIFGARNPGRPPRKKNSVPL